MQLDVSRSHDMAVSQIALAAPASNDTIEGVECLVALLVMKAAMCLCEGISPPFSCYKAQAMRQRTALLLDC